MAFENRKGNFIIDWVIIIIVLIIFFAIGPAMNELTDDIFALESNPLLGFLIKSTVFILLLGILYAIYNISTTGSITNE